MIEQNPKIVKLLDLLASQMMSVWDTMLKVYRESLAMWCPNYAKLMKTAETDPTFLATIKDMEDDIVENLGKRKMNKAVVRGNMRGCFNEIVVGVRNGSKRSLTIENRREVLALVAKGETPEDAIKKVKVKKGVVVPLKSFFFRPPNRGEQGRAYLNAAKAAWLLYLKENNINAVVEMRALPRESTRSRRSLLAN